MTAHLRSWIYLLVISALLPVNLLRAQASPRFGAAGRIDGQLLSTVVSNPLIRCFDLSPDGKLVAVLAVAGTKVGAPLWLVTVDTGTRHVVASRELGPSAFPTSLDFGAQVLYSSDQRYLVVQDLQEIKVLDARSLESVRTIPNPASERGQGPLFVVGASGVDVFVCAFAPRQQPAYGLHPTPVRVEVVDVSSGKVLGEWSSEDVPQSVSANGDLIAVSSWQPHQGVVPLQVVDKSGRKVMELADGFSFRKTADPSKPLGEVLGIFLGNQEILLSPDENFDPTGHTSGESLKVLDITGKQTQQSVTPRHYGPQGGLAVSADGRTILATSWYVPASILAQPHAVLPASEPELLIVRRDATLHVDSALPIPEFGLSTGGRLATRSPRISSDGSVIAITQNGGITVLMRNPHN